MWMDDELSGRDGWLAGLIIVDGWLGWMEDRLFSGWMDGS